MGREVVAIRSCDIVIIVGGRSGTLGEFSVAYDEGKIIGVLNNTGGITGILKDLEKAIKKPTGSEVVYDDDPARLVQRLLKLYQMRSDPPPH
jgi:predicted Rossmann-fold nucleotide-binding protein